MVRRGIAFLEPSNTTVYPETRVEELDLHRDLYFARGLRVRMGYVLSALSSVCC